MTPGKMAAQAGHAYLNSYLKAQTDYPEQVVGYQEGGVGTKVCLKASSEMDLEKIFIIASKSGVPCSRIEDSGHVIEGTVFDGSSILTAVGIGPIRRDQAKFLRKLKLVC
jgi:peptidyl-tRNA hydrolase